MRRKQGREIVYVERGGDSSAKWLFWGALLWLVWTVLNWRHDWFVATDKRFLLFYGFIRRRVAMMPLLKVTDMTYDRSPLGRIVGYGTFVLESAGNDQALSRIDHVPDADEHYRAICTMLFGPHSQLRFPPGYGPGTEGPAAGGGGPEGGSGGGPGGSGGSGDGGDDSTGPAVIVGPGEGPVRVSRRGHPPGPGHQPESWYRSSNLRGPSRLGDTGEPQHAVIAGWAAPHSVRHTNLRTQRNAADHQSCQGG